jgi:hypothetical protein
MDIDVNEIMAGMREQIGRLSQDLAIAHAVIRKYESGETDDVSGD